MTLLRRNPANELDLFRRQMDRRFDEMAGDREFDLSVWNPAIELVVVGWALPTLLILKLCYTPIPVNSLAGLFFR
mgnify:FL=1